MPLQKPPHDLRVQVTRNWVEEVLAFANLKDPDNIGTPTMLRTVDDENVDSGVDAQGTRVDSERQVSKNVLPEFTGVLGHDGLSESQSRLREMLNTIIEHGKSSAVDQLINDILDGAKENGVLTYRGGYLQFQPLSNNPSLDQWWGIGIATLLDTGLGNRVRQCRSVECSTYFVDWPGRKGQPRYYCCTKHSDQERLRKHRKEKKRKLALQKAKQSMGY